MEEQVLDLVHLLNRKMNEKFFYDSSFIDYVDVDLEHFFYDLSFDDYSETHSSIRNIKELDIRYE
jgi:hypothetical protein